MYLPGNEGLHFKGGQCCETGRKAEPPELNQRDAVQQHTVREDESDVRPAHTGENSQHTVRHVNHRFVLWDGRKCDIRKVSQTTTETMWS